MLAAVVALRLCVPCIALAVALACGSDTDGRATSLPPTIGTGVDAETTGAMDTSSDGGGVDTTSTSTTAADSSTSDAVGTTAVDGAASSTGAPVAMCPPAGALDCTPGPGRTACEKIESCFAGVVGDAVQATVNENPSWFQEVDGGTSVLDVDSFVGTVAAKVATQGLCSIRDPNDALGLEVGVKHDNEYAESFRLVTSGGLVRYRGGSYTATCWPAWF